MKTSEEMKELSDAAASLVREGHELIEAGSPEKGYQLIESARKIRSSLLIESGMPRSFIDATTRLLKDLGIDYAVIGGIAVSLHGTPRSTQDIDFLVDKMPDEWKTNDKEFMRSYGFYANKSRTGKHLILDHDQGMIELLLADSPMRQWAIKNARMHNILGSNLKVIEPDALIGLKLQAIVENPKRKAKDFPDCVSVYLNSKPDTTVLKTMLNDHELKILNVIETQMGD